MNGRFTHLLAVAATVLTPAIAHAQLGSMTYQYFKVGNVTGNHDFQGGIDGAIVTGLVQNHLGPDGLPLVSTTPLLALQDRSRK